MPDSTHHLSEARTNPAQPILGTPIPARETQPDPTAGWLVLHDCCVATGVRVDMLVVRAGAGIAILETEPRWTPEARHALERTLDAAGFHARHPGRLPIIHRRVPVLALPLVTELVADSFQWQPLPTIPPEHDWVATLRDILEGVTPVAGPKPEPEHASATAHTGSVRNARRRRVPTPQREPAPGPASPGGTPASPKPVRDAADPLAALRDAVLPPLTDTARRDVATLRDLNIATTALTPYAPAQAGLPARVNRATRFRQAAATWPYRFMTAREVQSHRSWSALLLAGLVVGLGAWNVALMASPTADPVHPAGAPLMVAQDERDTQSVLPSATGAVAPSEDAAPIPGTRTAADAAPIPGTRTADAATTMMPSTLIVGVTPVVAAPPAGLPVTTATPAAAAAVAIAAATGAGAAPGSDAPALGTASPRPAFAAEATASEVAPARGAAAIAAEAAPQAAAIAIEPAPQATAIAIEPAPPATAIAIEPAPQATAIATAPASEAIATAPASEAAIILTSPPASVPVPVRPEASVRPAPPMPAMTQAVSLRGTAPRPAHAAPISAPRPAATTQAGPRPAAAPPAKGKRTAEPAKPDGRPAAAESGPTETPRAPAKRLPASAGAQALSAVAGP